MSTRSLILANLTARLGALPGIVSAAPWGQQSYDLDSLPALAWRDGIEREDSGIFGFPPRYRLRVAVAGYLAGTTPAVTARQLLADVLAAVGTDPKYAGLADRTDTVRLELRVAQKADVIAACLATIDIIYTSFLVETLPGDNTITADGEILTADGETLTW